jgi:quinol monooxygenase YgiN
MTGPGYGDFPRGEPRTARPDPEDGPFGRRPAYNDQRDSFRDYPRDGLRDNPRDGLPDYSRDDLRDNPRDGLPDYPRDGFRDNPRDGLPDSRDGFRGGLRDNGGPVGRHSSVRPDWRERDAGPWGQPESEIPVPEFIPTLIAPSVPPGGAASSRPFGRLLTFTLREDRAAEFDRLAEEAAEGVRVAEPDTLVYVFHTAPTEPMQRIIYEIYRDRAAFESHQRQPHIQRFTDEVKPCVLGSNVIDLRLKYAKVAPLQGASLPGGGQPTAALSGPPQPSGGRADIEATARHRAPRPLETASRSLGDERYDSWSGEQAGPGGGGRRVDSADDWPSGRDWGRS